MRHIMWIFLVVALIGLAGVAAVTLVTSCARADDFGIRYSNLVGSNGIFDLDFSSSGKMFQVKYDWEPLKNGLGRNVFFEGGTGAYFNADFDTRPYWLIEASPGIQVQEGPVRLRLSQGISYLAYPPEGIQFGTHISAVLQDSGTGAYVGLERSHYSTGSSGGRGYDFTGFIVGVHF